MEQYNNISSYLASEKLSKTGVKNIILTAAIANAMEPTDERREVIAECLELFNDVLDSVI